MYFKSLIGQDLLKTALQGSLQTGEIAHAYLFSGPPGCGKKTIAALFTQALNCRGEKELPCQDCLSCHKISSGAHPDVYYLKPEGASLGIDQLREAQDSLFYLPAEADKKVCIIENAELLTRPAANSLLKILEEPPRHLIFILLCNQPWILLPTIISRCTHFALKPFTVKEMSSLLAKKATLTREEIEIISALAGGNPGKALEMVAEGQWPEKYEEAWELIMSMENDPLESIFNKAEAISRRDDLRELLDLMLVIYRDRLLFNLGGGKGRMMQFWNLPSLNNKKNRDVMFGNRKDLFSLEKICYALLEVQGELFSNVNRRLALEVLFLKMRGVV